MTGGMEMHVEWMLYVGAGVFGFFMFPYLATMSDFASETAFPIGEAISTGTLLFGGQLFGVLASLVMSLFVFDGKSIAMTRHGELVILIIMILGVVCLHLSKSILKRTEYEKNKSGETVSSSLLS
jgi:hypothetical protein